MAKRRRQGFVRGSGSNSNAKLESVVANEQVEANGGAAFDSRVDIYVNHYRTRLLDPSNCGIKAAEDAIVTNGVLRGDTTKEVREVRHRQIKVSSKEEEKTVIMIRPVKGD